MILFYCTADGSGPEPMIDWQAELAEARQKYLGRLLPEERNDEAAAIAAIDAANTEVGVAMTAVSSHVVRNGNHPFAETAEGRISSHEVAAGLRTGTLDVMIGDSVDAHGGGLARLVKSSVHLDIGRVLLCPECAAPVRAVSR